VRGLAWLFVWLLPATLSADWRAADGYRWQPVTPNGAGVGFTKMAAIDAGIGFTNRLSDDRSITNRNLLSGSGVAAGDVDGDGRPDLFFCGLDSSNELHRNLGDWRFTNVTATALPGVAWSNPVSGANDSTGTAFADVDGDGDLDLLVNALGGGTRLFVNDGRGRFAEATDAAGLRSRRGATSLALADVDADGDLDLYVAHFRPTTILDQPNARYQMRQTAGGPVVVAVNGRPVTEPDFTNRFRLGPSGDVQELGEPDALLLNDGRGVFAAVSWTDGTFADADGRALSEPPMDWGLALQFRDIDADGRPDLYVCNDLWTPDRVWINATVRGGPVRFRALGALALRSNSTFCMGVDFADVNRDGFLDLFTVDMFSRNRAWRQTQMAGASPVLRLPGQFGDRAQLQRNALHLNRGDGTWAEVAWWAGVEASEWSWGPMFVDVDLDGFEDVLVPNGQLRDFQDGDGADRITAAQARGEARSQAQIAALVRTLPRLATPNVAFRNRGDGTFAEVAGRWGMGTGSISQGAALADLDGDGDPDVVFNDLMDAPALYRNEATAARVAVRLRGTGANTVGAGARITVDTGGALPRQFQDIVAGGRYLSGDEPQRTFATGKAEQVTIEVRWPSGRGSRVSGVPANSVVEIREPSAEASVSIPLVKAPTRWFEDVSTRLNHVHADEPFDDFARQPLLPEKLSQDGPGVAWADVNRDGAEDLVVGAGRGGSLAVLLGDGRGGFTNSGWFAKPTGRDLTAVLPLNGVLFAGVANYEDGQTNGGALRLHDVASQRSGEVVLNPGFSTGPLAAADLDGDGVLEIFVGGRAVAGRWPEPASSLLVRQQAGRLTVAQRLEALGLVTSACFTDLTGDGRPELVVMREWAAPALFRWTNGTLEPFVPEVTGLAGVTRLDQLMGWWSGAVAGDFDEDGRMDLVLGNRGRNTRTAATPEAPARMYFGDLGSGSGLDLVQTWHDGATQSDRPERELMLLAMVFPTLRERAPTYAAYSRATVKDLFGDAIASARRLEVRVSESIVLLNRGDRFEARPLPGEAQWSPVSGLCVADFDGDGHDDVFLAQNFFATHPLMERSDAGRGLWLRGDGRGGFGAELSSGVAVYGEARGAAVSDFDGDGRVDLAVAQNGAATTLWHNVGARPGLRVGFDGPSGNPDGVGVAVRLVRGERKGPWRERHSGSGHWSADSPVLVLGVGAEAATAVEWRWPGAAVRSATLPAEAHEIRLGPGGELRVIR
jgi:enediyne biosynthesis protein E4